MLQRFWLGALLALTLGVSTIVSPALAARTPKVTTAILVDKKTNMLHIADYVDGSYQIIKSFHATLGKVKGDKETEGDLKTPEGIYTFKSMLRPPSLKPKFGKLAFYVSYPNAYDQLAGHTGFDIMLHATDTPTRLKQDYDSEGCIVVNNDEIEELKPYIRVGLTPILVFPELTDKYMHPGRNGALRDFFKSWVKSWESRDIDAYIAHYHTDFSAQGMDRDHWKSYKERLNHRYASISIGPEDVKFYVHPKYSMITFTQNYRSKLKNGHWGHRSRGTKILYVAEEAGQPKIIAETYTTLMW